MTNRFLRFAITTLILFLSTGFLPAGAMPGITSSDEPQPENTPLINPEETPTPSATVDPQLLTTDSIEPAEIESVAPQNQPAVESTPTPPAAPVLLSPLQNTCLSETQILLQWDLVPVEPPQEPHHYQVQVSRTSKFKTLSADLIIGAGESQVTSPELTDGKYYWHVRAISFQGAEGKWSTARIFIVDTVPPAAPRLASPSNGKTVRGIPVYSWKSVSGAKYYQFRFTSVEDMDFAAPVYTSDLLTTRSHHPIEQGFATWLWQVRAQDAAGNWSAWSTARTVTVKPTIPLKPPVLSPANKAIVEQSTVDFAWDKVKDADHFQVQVSMSSRFSPLEVDEILEPGATTFSADLYNGLHYWRVRAVNVDGEPGAWSAMRSLRVKAPLVVLDCPTCWHPAPGATWHIQYNGELDTSPDVAMVDVDLVETPQETIDALHAQGRKVVCYFSGGSWENYRDDAAQFPSVVKGRVMSGWPDEKWLDIRRLDILAPIMQVRLDLAVEKGCDGVDPDNMDGYQNKTGFSLTSDDQLNYNTWIANQAHQRGLAVGLKNDLGQITQLTPFFDWQLNEQCFYYEECDLLLPFVEANKAVFNIEYELEPADFCAQANSMQFSSMQKHLNLDAWMQPCW